MGSFSVHFINHKAKGLQQKTTFVHGGFSTEKEARAFIIDRCKKHDKDVADYVVIPR